MATQEKEDIRLQTIPIIHVRGNHYDVGFAVVRTFQEHLESNFNKLLFREKPSSRILKISSQLRTC